MTVRSYTLKLKAGRYLKPVQVEDDGKHLYLRFGYNKALLEEVRSMQGARWLGYNDPPRKVWRVKKSMRNLFQLDYLQGKNVYEDYDKPLVELPPITRPLYEHQLEFVAHILTRHYCIIAGEMGTGKTLAAIEVMDYVGGPTWYVGPRSGIKAVTREFYKWDLKNWPIKLITYEGLTKIMQNGLHGSSVPQIVIFDESSKIKTETAQRSKAALLLANAIRKEYGKDGYAILMSGTPAPKSPVDWWHQTEVARPGFLKEGSAEKLRRNLAFIEERENLLTGGVYPHLIGWKDSEDKCAKCGKSKDEGEHVPLILEGNYHKFEPATNEVARLYRRMEGLVLVRMKADCLDLPEIVYEVRRLKPTIESIRIAKIIKNTAPRAVQALTLLRELSDGFQYTEKKVGERTCETCHGKCKIMHPTMDGPDEEIVCPTCGGKGITPIYERDMKVIPTPKDEELISLLEEHEDVGRLIVWCGFTGTVDKVTKLCLDKDWTVLRIDGRGMQGFDAFGDDLNSDTLLGEMDKSYTDKHGSEYDKLVVVANPQAGGMALTLTASPTEVFYSNSFSGEARMQAEARFHRAGMDTNRGARVIDLINLPTDMLVLDNLKQKRRLQDISMGEIENSLKEVDNGV